MQRIVAPISPAQAKQTKGWRRFRSGRRSRLAMVAAAVVGATGLVPLTASPAEALAVDVRLTVSRVEALDSFEEPGSADFYGVVTIDGGTPLTSDQCQFEDEDVIEPNWEFKKEGIDLSKGSVTVTLEIWDDDDPCDEPFSFRGDDEDAGLNAAGDRKLTFQVALAPCALSGGISGSCGADITTEGNADDDNAKVTFQVSVAEPPSAPGQNIRCMHDPIWPKPGETVKIRAEYLDGNIQPDVKIADRIQVFTGGNMTTPAGEALGAEEYTYTTAPLAGGTFSYACRLVDDGSPVWTGWRTVAVGPPAEANRPIPVMLTGPSRSRIDVVLIPDKDDYPNGSSSKPFLDDMKVLVEKAYFGQGDNTADASILLTNQDTFNIWLAADNGDASGTDTGPCTRVPPPFWEENYSFANVGAILHVATFRDCAGDNTFSAESNDFRVFRHEQGHRPFGLADEYCHKRPGATNTVCDGGYFQADPHPNVYEDGDACEGDLANLGRAGGSCQRWVDDRKGDTWETSEPVTGDLMVNNTTPQAADIRRIDWMLNVQCASGNC